MLDYFADDECDDDRDHVDGEGDCGGHGDGYGVGGEYVKDDVGSCGCDDQCGHCDVNDHGCDGVDVDDCSDGGGR